MSENENTLCFGFDESNHAGQNKKGEIIVCAYSPDQEDSIVKEWPNRRDYASVKEWLEKDGHDYRFKIFTGDKYRFQCSAINLTEATPDLILSIMTEPGLNITIPPKIKLYFDGGGFHRDQKEFLREHFGKLGMEVVVNNFIKKNKNESGKIRKGPHCPKVVYLADILANHLVNLQGGELLTHPKLIV